MYIYTRRLCLRLKCFLILGNSAHTDTGFGQLIHRHVTSWRKNVGGSLASSAAFSVVFCCLESFTLLSLPYKKLQLPCAATVIPSPPHPFQLPNTARRKKTVHTLLPVALFIYGTKSKKKKKTKKKFYYTNILHKIVQSVRQISLELC